MATPTVLHQPHQRWSLDDLSTELLCLILKQLGDVDARSLSAARLVSARFNAMVTPMKYQTLRMTQDIIDPWAENDFPEGITNIYAYTRHVKVDSDLNAHHVKNLLNKIKRLSSVTWRYVQEDGYEGEFCVPTDILPPQYIQSSMVKLYIEDLPLQEFSSEKGNPYLKAIPTRILASLKMAATTPPLTARVKSLKDLLVNSPRLETFWYNDKGQGTEFELSGSERLPPFEELRLRSYDWRHGSAAVRQHWDFSKIRHLELVDVPLSPFLASVSFPDFRHLKILHLDDSSMFLPDIRRDTTTGQYVLIKQIQALIDLQITCDTQSFPVDGISRHAKSLQKLRFRDYTGFEDEHCRCPTMKIEDLDIISQKLVNLRTLELDMDERCCEPHHFLRTLCNFRQLNTLTLHSQTVLNPLEDIETNVDLDRERAMHILSLLVQGKRSASWRSITINVGGWKPIMVRRLSASWREIHSRGLFAERCFIMEMQENGALAVREKLPTRESRLSHLVRASSLSRTASPESNTDEDHDSVPSPTGKALRWFIPFES